MELIDKAAIVAEIDRRIESFTNEKNQEGASQIDKLSLGSRIAVFQELKVFIDTLEVKDVELNDDQIADIIQNLFPTNQFIESETLLLDKEEAVIFAKYFYELGLNANNNSVIEKACEWIKNNVTYTHPRTGETKCAVNLNAFIDAMKGE